MKKIAIWEEFVSKEPKSFSFKIGHELASALSGFIAGAVFASLVWGSVAYFLSLV